jgi:NAD-dependent SIR2 family protein deacetylase
VREWGYCTECEKMVEVEWEVEVDDETGERWCVPTCPECGEVVPNCINCAYFDTYEEDRDKAPWFNARGYCPLGTVLAGNRACPLFKPIGS